MSTAYSRNSVTKLEQIDKIICVNKYPDTEKHPTENAYYHESDEQQRDIAQNWV